MGKRSLMRDFTIGARLKGLRTDAGLTQRQVADDLGIPVSTYSNYENDNRYPAPDMLERICEFFRVSGDYLLGYDPQNVGDRVRKCRHNAGLTQQQLADRSGVSLDVVKRMELCDERISKKSVEKVAAGLGVTADYLLCQTMSPDLIAIKATPDGEPDREAQSPEKAQVSDDDIKFALFGGGPVTDEQFEEVKRFAQFIKERDIRSKDH